MTTKNVASKRNLALEQFFLTVDQNNFAKKIPLFDFSFISGVDSNYQLGGFAILLTAWIAVMVV
jgi:hypothetical protein